MKIRLQDVEVADLNNVCIMIISKFARILREHNGTVIELRHKHVVREVSRHASMAKNPQLETLYLRLKVEIKNHLNRPEIKKSSFNKVFGDGKLRDKIHARRIERNSERKD